MDFAKIENIANNNPFVGFMLLFGIMITVFFLLILSTLFVRRQIDAGDVRLLFSMLLWIVLLISPLYLKYKNLV